MIKAYTKKVCTQGSLKISIGGLMLSLLLLITTFSAMAQSTFKVTGTVTDAKGETLIGLSVRVKGTTNGTLTDVNGKYTLTVPNEQAVLTFSYVGFVTKDETVGTRRTINVSMSENANSLTEVVVTGYGQTVAKRDLAGSIGAVSAKQIAERQPVNLFDALEGQLAGAQIITDGGDPLSQGNIQIRGASTINGGNGPLYVIDGILSQDAMFLNPADIESIEVLKDAASAAIYGVRGANGVILITTKRGKDGKPTVSANYYHLFGQLAHKLHTVSANDLRYYRKYRGDGNNGVNVDSVNHYLNADNDYQDLLFRTGNKDNLNLSLSGGNKGFNYYASANYVNDRSIVINSQAQTIASTLKAEYQPNDKFRIINNVDVLYQTGNSIPVGNTAKQVFERNPWTSIYKPDGTLAGYVESKRNPVAYALLSANTPTTTTVQDALTASYQIVKDLKFTALGSARVDNIATQIFSPSSLTSGGTGNSTGSTENEKKINYQGQAYFNYNHNFGPNSNLNGVLGFSREYNGDDDLTFGFTNYLIESALTSNSATFNLPATSTTATRNATESVFARMQYSYKQRYIINGTIRRDYSSKFGPDSKYGDFPALGLAWRFSDESFMKWSKSFLDDGKLRYSIGKLGNDKIGDNLYQQLLLPGSGDGSTNSGIYNGFGGVSFNTTFYNPAIHWESTTTQNFGMDLTFLKGRLTFTPEYYIKHTSGLLYGENLAEETGFAKRTINLGDIENQGLELTLSGTPVVKKNFSWNVNANVSVQSAGLIKSLAGGQAYYNGSYILKEGGHIGDFYLLKNLGVYQYDVSNSYSADGQRLTPVGVSPGVPTVANPQTATSYLLNGQPYTGPIHQLYRNGNKILGGGTIWQDTNNDGVIDDNDRQVLGNATPKVYFGLNNFFTYKGFTINFLFNASFGNKVYNSVANGQNANSSTYSPPAYAAIYNSWHNQGDIATYPNFTQKDTYGSIANGINSLYLEDGSFIRLSSAKLTYNIDKSITSRLGVRFASIYAYGNNLITWTNYSWYDPEFTSSSPLQQGFDNGKYPRRREIGFGLNVSF
jgi:TonB-linked SusC/RagA family outer membrane protein